jgi:hypothetical protein
MPDVRFADAGSLVNPRDVSHELRIALQQSTSIQVIKSHHEMQYCSRKNERHLPQNALTCKNLHEELVSHLAYLLPEGSFTLAGTARCLLI